MFIVIEGTDASGKSSLVKAVVEQLRASNPTRTPTEYHKGKPDELTRLWVLKEYVIDVERNVFQASNAVADRWHWGEVTYAPHKRPHTNADGFGLLGVAGWRWTEMFLASRGVAQFWLYQPLDVIKARLTSRGDDFVSADELEMILDLYQKAAENAHSLAWKTTPRDDMSEIPMLASLIIEQAEQISNNAAHLVDFPEYIGAPKPKILLIGDKRNVPPENTILPFMPINNNSGEYLLTALPEDLWRNVGIINAGDIYGFRLLDLYERLGSPMVVALGRMAEREVRTSGLYVRDHVVLPHPQYVRRFHHQDKTEYGLAIQALGSRDSANTERFKHWILP